MEKLKPSQILKPGMVGINLKGAFDPMGTVDVVLQGDTKAAHVWWVLPSGKIASTGAYLNVFYGEYEPDEYLVGKKCFLLETMDPLTPDQLKTMQAAHESLLKSGVGRLYGFWKIECLFWLEAVNGEVTKMGSKATPNKKPTCPICSQAVAYPFWKAGIPVGQEFGKEDWSAVLPKDFLIEAQYTSAVLNSGKRFPESPCYRLKLVQSTPFSF